MIKKLILKIFTELNLKRQKRKRGTETRQRTRLLKNKYLNKICRPRPSLEKQAFAIPMGFPWLNKRGLNKQIDQTEEQFVV